MGDRLARIMGHVCGNRLLQRQYFPNYQSWKHLSVKDALQPRLYLAHWYWVNSGQALKRWRVQWGWLARRKYFQEGDLCNPFKIIRDVLVKRQKRRANICQEHQNWNRNDIIIVIPKDERPINLSNTKCHCRYTALQRKDTPERGHRQGWRRHISKFPGVGKVTLTRKTSWIPSSRTYPPCNPPSWMSSQ